MLKLTRESHIISHKRSVWIMMTVNEVSKQTGVSVRTLHYYDQIGLLSPSHLTEANYRLYDDTALERLQSILLFRELEFPLKTIKEIVDSPHFDRNKALDQQIELLRLKKEHLDNLIDLALGIKMMGVKHLDFKAFNTQKIDEYAAEAKKSWGQSPAYEEFEQKTKNHTKEDWAKMNDVLMEQFKLLGAMKEQAPESEAVQAQVKSLQQTITDHFYNCTKEILAGLGLMYSADSRFTETIDQAGGPSTATFVSKAIAYYCAQ